jgi:hypothetical protein
MRIQLAGPALMQNWAKSTHSTVECKHSVGIVGEEPRCGESVGMTAGDLIGLNATLGRGLNINALPRNECRVAMGHPGNGCAYLRMLSLLLDGCANK